MIFGVVAMVLGWALLVFAAIKLVSLAISYLLTLLPLRLSVSDIHQEQQRLVSINGQGGSSLKRLAKRDLGEDNGAAIRPTATGSTESEMVLVPIVSISGNFMMNPISTRQRC